MVENSTGDDKFIIRSDGLVGINLINNGTDLNIKGTTTNETHFRIVSPTSNNPVFVVNNVLNNPANHILDVKHPDGTEILRVTSTDNFVVANGNNALKPGGGPWIAFSDKRLKKDITSYDEGLDLIKKITPVRFKYNGKGKTPNGGSEHVGIIAQDLQKIAPHMIITQEKDRDDGVEYLAVNGNAFTYMLINAVQEQQEQIETLQNKYDELLQRLEALEKK